MVHMVACGGVGGGLKAPTPPAIHTKLALPGRARFGRTDSRFYVPGTDGAAANRRPTEPTLTISHPQRNTQATGSIMSPY